MFSSVMAKSLAKLLAPLMAAAVVATLTPFLRFLAQLVRRDVRTNYDARVDAFGPQTEVGFASIAAVVLSVVLFAYGYNVLEPLLHEGAFPVAAIPAGIFFYSYFFLLVRWRAGRDPPVAALVPEPTSAAPPAVLLEMSAPAQSFSSAPPSWSTASTRDLPTQPVGLPLDAPHVLAAAVDDREARTRFALRLGGGLLVVSALISGLSLVLFPQSGPAPVGLIVDVAIGLSLLRGDPKHKKLAYARVFLGLVIYGGISLASADYVSLVLQLGLSAALLLLLSENPTSLRLKFGAALCVAVLLTECAAIAIVASGVKLNTVSGETFPIPGGVAQGTDAKFSLHVPDSFKVRERAAMKVDNPNADLWVVDEDEDTHIVVVCSTAGNIVDPAKYLDDVVQELATTGMKAANLVPPVMSGATARGYADLAGTANGVEVSYLVSVNVKFGRGCALYGFATSPSFPKARGILATALDSFKFEFDAFDGVPLVPANLGLSSAEEKRIAPALEPMRSLMRADERLLSDMAATTAGFDAGQMLSAFGMRLLPLNDLDRIAAVKVKMMESDAGLCASLYQGISDPAAMVRGLLRLSDDDIRAWGEINAKATKLEYARIGALKELVKERPMAESTSTDFTDGVQPLLQSLSPRESSRMLRVLQMTQPTPADACAASLFLHRAGSLQPELRARYLQSLLSP